MINILKEKEHKKKVVVLSDSILLSRINDNIHNGDIMAKKKGNPGKKKSYRNYAKAKSGGLVAGFIAGAGGAILSKFVNLGGYNQPISDLAVGMYMRNDTLQTIGGRSIGAMLSSGAFSTGTPTNNALTPLVG